MHPEAYVVDLSALPAEVAHWPLAGWYAEPLSRASAQALLARMHQGMHRGGTGMRPTFASPLLQWIARFWLEEDSDAEVQRLRALAPGEREQALVELIHGQLLLARRLLPAHTQLERGFTCIANLLTAEDYFVVLRRHALLRALPLQVSASSPQGLAQQLTEAAVIRRLQGPVQERPATTEGAHLDTLG